MTIGTTNGGTNWPGGAYDPETHTVFAPASNAAVAPLGMIEPPEGFSDIRYVAGTAGQPFVEREGPGFGSAADAPQRRANPTPTAQAAGRGRGRGEAQSGAPPSATLVQGLPIVKPPYGLLSAINLDSGTIAWQVPHGDTPDNVRNHAALQGLTIPKTGQSGAVGAVVTKTLVIMGDPPGDDDARPSAGRDVARLRQGDREGGRRRADAGAPEWLADDLHGRRPPVHRRRGERRPVLR